MARTKDALEIIDRMVGDDADLRQMIGEESVNASVAQMIYEARTDAGLTQGKLADLVGTKQPVIARLEDAEYEGHSLTMLDRIAKALNQRLRVEMSEAHPAPIKTLVYAMTHLGDPDANGCWGCNDCMGDKRSLKYEAVIGIGGVGAEPKRNEIAAKLIWIGIGPAPTPVAGNRGPEVTFDHFLPFGINGPDINEMAPKLAARLRTAVRLVKNLTTAEQAEAEKLLKLAKNAPPSLARAKRRAAHDQTGDKVACPRSPKIQKRPRKRCPPRRRTKESA